ncbi:MAG TPA: type IV pilus modification protein PilV [Gammaproteobacteria bacterium]|nr:type IV pilus modification protein PilV [Gammaproteobacteria bacterium]
MPHHYQANRSSGFTLVEILIALVILSVGLLGLAGLQTSSLRAGNDAYLRTQANMLAYSIIDRMRSNMLAVTSGDYNMSTVSATGNNCPASTNFNNAQELAAVDQQQWLCALAEKLPGASASIATGASGDRTQISITISWFEQRVKQGEKGADTTLTLMTLL